MTCIRARTSLNFDLLGPLTAELAALERKNNNIRLIIFSAVLDRILFIRAGMITYVRAWMSLKFHKIQPLVSMVTDRVMMGKTSPLFLGCFSLVPFHTCR